MPLHPITARRREAGMSRAQLARAARVAETDLARWERGSGFPESAAAVRIARHLGLALFSVLHTAIEQESAAGHLPAASQLMRAAR